MSLRNSAMGWIIARSAIIETMTRTVLLAIALAFSGLAQPLQDALHARIGDFPGTVSLYAKNLDTGKTIGIREAEPERTASTIKLPMLTAVFDAVSREQVQWIELLTINAQEEGAGSGISCGE